MKKYIFAFAMIISSFIVIKNVYATEADLRNFVIDPDIMMATFDDDSTKMENGALKSELLSISSSASSSRIEEEGDGNKYFVFEDGIDDTSGASMTIKPPGDNVYERFIFSFDISMPEMYAGRVNPATGKTLNNMTLDFNSVDSELAASGRSSYYVFSRSNTESKWFFQFTDAAYYSCTLDFDKWYTVRYEMNMKTHRYNFYIYDRQTNAIVSKSLNRMLRDKVSSGIDFPINNYYLRDISMGVNAFNNGGPVNLKLDNVYIAKESFFLNNAPIVSIANDTVTASVKVQNESLTEKQSPTLVLAIYGKDNKLIDITYSKVMVPAKGKGSTTKPVSADLTCSLKKPTLSSGGKACAFLLTSMYEGKSYFAPTSMSIN